MTWIVVVKGYLAGHLASSRIFSSALHLTALIILCLKTQALFIPLRKLNFTQAIVASKAASSYAASKQHKNRTTLFYLPTFSSKQLRSSQSVMKGNRLHMTQLVLLLQSLKLFRKKKFKFVCILLCSRKQTLSNLKRLSLGLLISCRQENKVQKPYLVIFYNMYTFSVEKLQLSNPHPSSSKRISSV